MDLKKKALKTRTVESLMNKSLHQNEEGGG